MRPTRGAGGRTSMDREPSVVHGRHRRKRRVGGIVVLVLAVILVGAGSVAFFTWLDDTASFSDGPAAAPPSDPLPGAQHEGHDHGTRTAAISTQPAASAASPAAG